MEETTRQLRKYENTLSVSGAAVIAFGVWTIAKNVLYYLQDMSLLWEDAASNGVVTTTDKVTSVVSMVIVLALDLALRLYMGRSARAESRGEDRGRKYIVFAWIIVFLDIAFGTFLVVAAVKMSMTSVLLTGMFVEFTSVFAMAEMATSAGRVKKLRKVSAEKGAQ